MRKLALELSPPLPLSGRTGGILLTLLLAAIGWSVSRLPVFDRIGPLACTLLAAILYRQFFGYPDGLRSGIRFSSGTLLRIAIIGFGLRLDIRLLGENGVELLALGAGAALFSIAAVTAFGRWWKADSGLTVLLAFGTGICGAAAVAAISPLLRSKEEDTAAAAGVIALAGTGFAAVCMLAQPWLALDAESYGIWVGASLHEIAHVAMAAAPAGGDAMAEALLAKMARVLMLVPACLLLAWRMRGRKAADSGATRGFPFPWFLAGFAAMSLLGSFVLPAAGIDAAQLAASAGGAVTLLMSMAMAGFGLHVHWRSLGARILRPLAAMAVGSLLLSALTFAVARVIQG